MVSVIIPAYNAEKTIGICLDALLKQDYTGAYEIIVVDDGSTDSTPDIISKYKKASLIRQNNSGPAAARNKGASQARGDIILFTDSDCIPVKNWISEMVKPFNDGNIVGVRGSYKTRQKELAARFVQLEYEDKYRYMRKDKYVDFMDTYSAGFKKDVFLEMNGYDTDFPVACAEDIELSYRLSNKGYKMVFNPDAVVYHTHPDSITAYLKKKYKFAFWRMTALKKNPNKAVKDSHTPQTMKLQVLFPPLIAGSIILSVFMESPLYLPLFSLLAFLLTTVSFALRACRSDITVGLLSPAILLLRATAQFWGVFRGVIYIALGKNKRSA